MPDKATPSEARQSGFTLIEILIVLVIISLTLGFALMAYGDFGRERRIQSSAQGLAQFISLIREKALLEFRTLTLIINQQGYHLQDQARQAVRGSLYQNHPFPPGTTLSLEHQPLGKKSLSLIMDASYDITAFKFYMGTSAHPHLACLQSDLGIELNAEQH